MILSRLGFTSVETCVEAIMIEDIPNLRYMHNMDILIADIQT